MDSIIRALIECLKQIFSGLVPMEINPTTIKDAILKGIVIPLKLPESTVNVLYAQAILETGNFKAWYFQGMPQKDGAPPTYNLYNRHKGSGRGEWTGKTKYISPGDADVRIYTDIYQSARDMAQLLSDPHYAKSLLALRQGDAARYYEELQKAGFSVSLTYSAGLKRVYSQLA